MSEQNTVRSTRDQVLHTLLSRGECTINELAEHVDINPISVRHHINKLEADGLVDSHEVRHGVGRPRRQYYLTEKGREVFPTRYIQLTLRLLEQLKESMPPAMVGALFKQMAQELVSGYQEDLADLSIEERLNLVTDLLGSEGFTVEWEKHGEYYQIREANCPYFRIGQNHPEVCSVDETLISMLLSSPAQKVTCMLHGDSNCTYIVPTLVTLEEKQE